LIIEAWVDELTSVRNANKIKRHFLFISSPNFWPEKILKSKFYCKDRLRSIFL
jgi:hypothetical protein